MKPLKMEMSRKEKLVISLQLLLYLSLFTLVAFVLPSCTNECDVENTYFYYEPVYSSMEEIRSSVELLPPVELKQVGKIYFNNGYLFINEPNEGIHIIDNRDPANPINLAFINIPGAFDLAVKGNILFSDSYMDLVAIDISNPTAVTELGRIEGLFQEYNSYGYYANDELGVVTDWQLREEVTMTESSCAEPQYDWGVLYAEGIALTNDASFRASQAVSPSNPGMGGSMARFALVDNFLYAVDNYNLRTVDVANAAAMSKGGELSLDWGVETIFPKEDNLFIGTTTGMHIMNISNPLSPELISTYDHIVSCDPVIVDNDIAYVTLRSGTECQGFTNQLEVIDISDLTSPQLLYTYEMFNPHGLGKDGNALFICDGTDGLKIYDASDNSKITDNLLAHYESIQAFDIIPFNNVAMMIGEDGFYQYDYSDLSNIKFLSHIIISNE
ncbi:LVIVD repeat-containing protein [Fulvivirga lutimaris]|uniref:LVIVD repeat-containing protein n=1 Tax=Fulvivirga lutimaris TaxID=1819566 RepID=UPI0012BD5DA5|nr:hypothetical protein [Fulvivirga lutimaris]MTI40851.1 hypothetical protein [Fulvivirga lutimaris]